jgi:hypothetical protein
MGAYGAEADVPCWCAPAVSRFRFSDRDGRERCTNCNGLVGVVRLDRPTVAPARRAPVETDVEDPDDDKSFRDMRALMNTRPTRR